MIDIACCKITAMTDTFQTSILFASQPNNQSSQTRSNRTRHIVRWAGEGKHVSWIGTWVLRCYQSVSALSILGGEKIEIFDVALARM